MRTHRPLSRQRGLSLVELMIAMTLGLLLLVALGSLYVSTSQSRVQLANSATQIENGRYALDVISHEVALGGYFGDSNLIGAAAWSAPNLCAAATNMLGFSNSPATVPVAIYGYAYGTNPAAPCLSNVVPNSEILVVRRVSTTSVTPTTMNVGQAYMQDSFCTTDTSPFIFSSGPAATFTLNDKSCNTLAELRQASVRIFYLATCDRCSNGGDGIPTLKVAELAGGVLQPTSIAQGIEDIHFSYGVDMDGNGSADCYVSDPGVDNSGLCTTVGGYNWTTSSLTNWSNVTAVRINVLARTLSPSAGWKDSRSYDLGRGTPSNPVLSVPTYDSYKRHVYAEVARVVNVAGPRE
ncbi:MAG: PilW family protein [Burkholderiaceae bacterium]|nr:PilW family protein [Ralstonia sp. LMG 7141]MDE2204725.1 PilW family protein [Burkholderiaceae bacterium]